MKKLMDGWMDDGGWRDEGRDGGRISGSERDGEGVGGLRVEGKGGRGKHGGREEERSGET